MIYILHVYIYSCTQHHAALRERAGVSSPSGLWDPGGLTAVPGRSQARPYRTAGTLVCIYIYMYMCLYIYIYTSAASWVTSLEQADLMITKFLNRLPGMEELTDPLLDGE